jgi:two-component system, NarL family, sensor kinase
LWVRCVALFAATVMFLSKSLLIPNQEEAPEALTVLLRAMALTYPTVGAFVASRRPGNPIGWILCGTGLLLSVRAFAMAYTQYGVAGPPGSLPGMEYAAWIAS